MDGLMSMLVMAFVIGLTGALAPGPTLVATIDSAMKNGWIAGPKVAIGHAFVELAIFILIICGLAGATQQYSHYISIAGGIALIFFGILTIMKSNSAKKVSGKGESKNNPYLAGVITSAANPYFWIWWLSIGSALVLSGLESGLILAGLFMIGHWCADFGWLTFVSTSLDMGKNLFDENNYRRILMICGGFLMLFGFHYLINA